MFLDSKQAASDDEITYCSANGEALSLTSAARLLVRKDVCKALLLLLPGLIADTYLSIYQEQALSLILEILRYEATRLGGGSGLQTPWRLHSYLASAHYQQGEVKPAAIYDQMIFVFLRHGLYYHYIIMLYVHNVPPFAGLLRLSKGQITSTTSVIQYLENKFD